jgi:HD superfamily phosphohydrolase
MSTKMMPFFNKRKILNDPIYGFITIPYEIIFDLIEHPFFQRLSRIRQLGLTYLVYPGALHTRFHHALGAMHLMGRSIEMLRSKGVKITQDEAIGVTIAILLHDIGHGPFSHALENSIVDGISHEDISSLLMDDLNRQFKGKLTLAIKIFNDRYPKRFLHQLVSGQLDMDRLDYLTRDSFFTGVSEGIVSYDRIIEMLNVVNDKLVIEEKAIYSVESFLISRRLMYWQVYLHKTVLSAENLLINILKRGKQLTAKGEVLFATPVLQNFLKNNYNKNSFNDQKILKSFSLLDDVDILASVKTWVNHPDYILSRLSSMMIDRKLYKIQMSRKIVKKDSIKTQLEKYCSQYGLSKDDASYLAFTGSISNKVYNLESDKIYIMQKNGKLIDFAKATDQLNIQVLKKEVVKHYLCYSVEE